jgi:hypothetical protein
MRPALLENRASILASTNASTISLNELLADLRVYPLPRCWPERSTAMAIPVTSEPVLGGVKDSDRRVLRGAAYGTLAVAVMFVSVFQLAGMFRGFRWAPAEKSHSRHLAI